MVTLNVWTKFNRKTIIKYILKTKKQDPSICCSQEIHLALRTWIQKRKKRKDIPCKWENKTINYGDYIRLKCFKTKSAI